ncbi:hypothetical protein [Methylocapsa sp. S129]|uniref:hypothetical protein n=1 Tax=Methylocapsa sp. S129 TaxID=1641869 RepID=UPI00131CFE7A|nr:hypothetical protein [Methylocapsa sp. S129]
MRKFLLLGTIGAAVALGAANAYALPSSSPYALSEPQAVDSYTQPDSGYGAMNEGRAAFVQGGVSGWSGPSYEDSTYYSRGK